jgi:hypothetical protein
LHRDAVRQKLGQPFRLRPLPSFFTREGNRLPFRDDFWVLRHVSDAEAEFKNRQTGVVFSIELANLKEIRIPDYFILNGDITVRGGTATFVSRKSPDEEFMRRRKPAEDMSTRQQTHFSGDRGDPEI